MDPLLQQLQQQQQELQEQINFGWQAFEQQSNALAEQVKLNEFAEGRIRQLEQQLTEKEHKLQQQQQIIQQQV